MGMYLYKVTGPVRKILFDGKEFDARLGVYWMKPWYDAWDTACRGSYGIGRSEIKLVNSYKRMIASNNRSHAVQFAVESWKDGAPVRIFKFEVTRYWDDANPIGYTENGGQSYRIVGEVNSQGGSEEQCAALANDMVAAYNKVHKLGGKK